MNALSQVTSPLMIVPAYGRVYNSVEAMIADWTVGKDFRIWNGPYCSIRDLEHLRLEASSVTLCCPSRDLSVTL